MSFFVFYVLDKGRSFCHTIRGLYHWRRPCSNFCAHRKMASFSNLDPFLPFPGEPTIPYQQWKTTAMAFIRQKQFHISRLPPRGLPAPPADDDAQPAQQAPPGNVYSDAEKNLDLYLALGTEGQRCFNGTPDASNFDRPHMEFVQVLDGLFHTPINRLIALRNFRHRMQFKDESANAFSAELRSLAKHCSFPDAATENSEIADTLIVNCFDSEVQQKLFAQSTTRNQRLTIDEVLQIMRAEESAKLDVKQLQAGDSAAKLAALKRTPRKGNRHKSPGGGATVPKRNSTQKPCSSCGRSGHAYMSPSCPALNSKCRFCSKIGHWDSVCRKKQSQQSGSTTVQSALTLGSCDSDSRIPCDLQLQPLSGSSRKRRKISFIADTGAEASTLLESDLKSHFPQVPLSSTDTKLKSFDNSADFIIPLGIVQLRATFKNLPSMDLRFFVVPDNCLRLLGINELATLGLMVDPRTRSVFAASPISAPTPEALMDSLEKEFPRLFSPGIGKVPNFQHRIQLKPDSVPIRAKMRYPPFSMEDDAKKALDELIREDVIEQIDKSEYVHPLHFIRKPDNSVRVTVDFSVGLNKNIVPSNHPLPLPMDIFNQVGEDRYFSKLDVSQAYHHIELAPESRHLTAFITPSHGLCQYKRTPMGLTDSGSAFQRCIEQSLSGLEGVHPYCDDILIRGKTRNEHDARLRKALQCLDSDNYRLKRSKLLIAQTEIPLLGHIISSSPTGTLFKPDPRNGSAILNLRPPSNLSELRSFLGCCNFYSSFIKNFAELTEPLHRLTRKNVQFEWESPCQKSFDVLKSRIASPEALVPFNPNLQTFLTTDASDVGLGAVLSQLQNGMDRPIAFAAKTLLSSERNYSTPEREALGYVFGAQSIFRNSFLAESSSSERIKSP